MKILRYILFISIILPFSLSAENWYDTLVTKASQILVETHLKNEEVSNTNKNYFIVLDVPSIIPQLAATNFLYETGGNSPFNLVSNSNTASLGTELSEYNTIYATGKPNFIHAYTILIKNIPFTLAKDIANANIDANGTLYSQLKSLEAIKDQDYQDAKKLFNGLISQITTNAGTLLNNNNIVVFGTGIIVGQYAKESAAKAAFVLQTIETSGSTLANYAYLSHLKKTHKTYVNEGNVLKKDKIWERLKNVTHDIVEHLKCSFYNDCNFDENSLANTYAKQFYAKFKNTTTLNKALLQNVCKRLNGIGETDAYWAIGVTAEKYTNTINSSPFNALYNQGFTNQQLEAFSDFIDKYINAKKSLAAESKTLTKDSVLEYGYYHYRNIDFLKTISINRKIDLLEILTSSNCADVNSISQVSDPNKYCERIVISLIQNIQSGEEAALLDKLKSKGLLWKITVKVDNSTVGFLGKDNYTEYMMTLCSYWRKAYTQLLSQNKTSATNVIGMLWDESFFNDNSYITVYPTTNKIYITHKTRNQTPSSGQDEVTVYDPVLISPINPSKILGVPEGQHILVPGIFLDWLDHKKTLADLGTTATTAIDVLALATGVGELYKATSWGLRGVALLEASVATTDLIFNMQDFRNQIVASFPAGQQAKADSLISKYQTISMCINVAVAGKGLLLNFNQDCSKYKQLFDEANTSLATNLPSDKYDDLKLLRDKINSDPNQFAEFIDNTGNIPTSIGNLAQSLTGFLKSSYDDLLTKGFSAVEEAGKIKFLDNTGRYLAEIKNGKLIFKYAGFGGDVIITEGKATTILGKFAEDWANPNSYGTRRFLGSNSTPVVKGFPNGSINRGVGFAVPNRLNFLDLPEAQYNSLINNNIKSELETFLGMTSNVNLASSPINDIKTLIKSSHPNLTTSQIENIVTNGISKGKSEFWINYNLPFLEQAFQRGDDVRLVSDPAIYQPNAALGETYKKELDAIMGNNGLAQQYGYTFNSTTKTFIKQ